MNRHDPKVWNKRDPNVPADAVYVGRGTPWGNPHRVGRCFRCGLTHTREEAIRRFLMDLSVSTGMAVKAELKGKDLVCHCAPLPCHADVLLRIANE